MGSRKVGEMQGRVRYLQSCLRQIYFCHRQLTLPVGARPRQAEDRTKVAGAGAHRKYPPDFFAPFRVEACGRGAVARTRTTGAASAVPLAFVPLGMLKTTCILET